MVVRWWRLRLARRILLSLLGRLTSKHLKTSVSAAASAPLHRATPSVSKSEFAADIATRLPCSKRMTSKLLRRVFRACSRCFRDSDTFASRGSMSASFVTLSETSSFTLCACVRAVCVVSDMHGEGW